MAQVHSVLKMFFLSGCGRKGISNDKCVMMFCYFMAHQDQYRLIGERFGVTTSACYKSVQAVLHVVNEHLMVRYICWPSYSRQREIAGRYEAERNFPGKFTNLIAVLPMSG